MFMSLVAAVDDKGGIGKDGGLPWRIPGDMAFFRELTTCPDPGLIESRCRMDLALPEKRVFTFEKLVDQIGLAREIPAPAPSAFNAVLMGRKTWESLPARFRPLPGRLNIVLSRDPSFLPLGGAGSPHADTRETKRGGEERAGSAEAAAEETGPEPWETVRKAGSLDEALGLLDDAPGLRNIYVIGGGEIYREALRHPRCKRLYLTRVAGDYGCDTVFPAFEGLYQDCLASPFLQEKNYRYRFMVYRRDC